MNNPFMTGIGAHHFTLLGCRLCVRAPSQRPEFEKFVILKGDRWLPLSTGKYLSASTQNDWIGVREILQETIDFPIKYGVFRLKFSRKNQSIDQKKSQIS
jgi:hypothetical protein